jgi:hypothetical protein
MAARKTRLHSGGSAKSEKHGATANPLARAVAAAKTMKKKGRVTAALNTTHRGSADAGALARKVSAAKTNRRKEEVTHALGESQRRR